LGKAYTYLRLMDVVLVDASRLQSFFYKYEFDNKEERTVRAGLLEYIPLACNYKFDPETLVAEPTKEFVPVKRDLKFQLDLKFSPGCEFLIEADYYERLTFLGRIHKILLGWRKNRPRPSPRNRPHLFVKHLQI